MTPEQQKEAIEVAQAMDNIPELKEYFDESLKSIQHYMGGEPVLESVTDLKSAEIACSYETEHHGPFPSNSMFDPKNSVDFLERAYITFDDPHPLYKNGKIVYEVYGAINEILPEWPKQIDYAKAILNLAQRAKRLGEYKNTTKEEAQPFLDALNRGLND